MLNPIATDTTAAHERADAIRHGIDATAAALADVPRLVIDAYKAEDWRTLGYGSWKDYVTGEFGTSLLKLDKATRKTWTLSLKGAGLSDREIAPVTNVSAMQVSRDSRVTNVTDLDTARQMTANARDTPETKLFQKVQKANKNLIDARDLMRDGVQVNGLAEMALDTLIEVVKEIINIGEAKEAL